MSYSNPKQQNPAKKFIEWSGSKGEFYYYDKDSQENVRLEMPIYFIVLDELHTVTGYHEKSGSGIMANEVRNPKNDILRVKSWRNGLYEKGLWQDIKEAVTSGGGKYCKSVYAILYTSKGTELVNFKFTGSSFGGANQEKGCKSGWINAKFNKEQYAIRVRETEMGKKGSTEFQCPVFEPMNIKEEHHLQAIDADNELQKYLKYYFDNGIEEKEEVIDDGLPESENIDMSDVNVENKDIYNSDDETDDLPF